MYKYVCMYVCMHESWCVYHHIHVCMYYICVHLPSLVHVYTYVQIRYVNVVQNRHNWMVTLKRGLLHQLMVPSSGARHSSYRVCHPSILPVSLPYPPCQIFSQEIPTQALEHIALHKIYFMLYMCICICMYVCMYVCMCVYICMSATIYDSNLTLTMYWVVVVVVEGYLSQSGMLADDRIG